eukprot:GEMP01032380.1.p1 GENE.GEMP01032380.1~~GEMP01032380.1.p1  ORF type:complete len:192 (+),score=27.59 GEMP01032380.1:118-693(+)
MTSYNQKDSTRQETIWRENRKKEHKYQVISKDFQMNLMRPLPNLQKLTFSHNRIEMVTEKEIKQSPQERQSAQDISGGFEVNVIRHLGKKPQERWAIPFTTSHDMGWLLQRPMQSNELHCLSVQNKLEMTQPAPSIHQWGDNRLSRSEPDLKSIRVINSAKWRRPRRRSDVVLYAEAYVSCLGSSPFGRNR